MFCERDQFKSDEAFDLYHDAITFAHAPGSCVLDPFEAHICTYKAIGMLLMAQEIEPLNPHIAWMLIWIIDFDYHSTDFLINISNNTLKIFEDSKKYGEYDIDCDHLSKLIGHGLKTFIKKKNDGVLMTI